jgi:hypothetical protein
VITIQQDLTAVEPRFLLTLPIPVATGGSATPTTAHRSVELESLTGAQAWTNYQVESPLLETERLTVANPSAAAVDYPFVSRIGVGSNALLDFTDRFGFKWRTGLDFEWQSSATTTLPSGFVSGSIPAHCLGLIEGARTGNDDTALFSSINHSTQSYVLNPSCWAAGWDFSGVAVWNSRSNDTRRAGTAITRRHIWLAWHYRLQAGDTIRFRRPDGTVDTHTILAINPGNDFNSCYPMHEVVAVGDFCIAVLDRYLHESIAVYPIAPWARNVISVADTFPENVVPGYAWGAWVPVETQTHLAHATLHLTQSRQVGVMVAASKADGAAWTANQVTYAGETLPYRAVWLNFFSGSYVVEGETSSGFTDDYADWVIPAVAGDSGCPIFCPTSASTLVVASLFTDPNGGMLAHEATMNAIIRTTDAVAGITTGLTVTVAPDPTAP